jgi:oligopeptide transport system substrate-binding protein
MKTTRFRRLQIVIALIALAAILVSTSFSTVSKAQSAKVIRMADSEPDTIDPQRASYVNQVAMIQALHRGLLRIGEDGKPAPSIAKEVPTKENGGISADGLTYTFKLNDWKWSDGKGMVAAGDFVYAWRRLVDPLTAAPYATFLTGVKNADAILAGSAKPEDLGIEAVDDKTVKVTLERQLGYFNEIVALWVTYPVRKDNVERAGDPASGAWTDPANGEVVGSGPFIIKTWDHQKEIIFEKNPNFSGSPAKLDRVVLSLNDDAAIHFAAYKAGELDVAGFPAAEYPAVKADPVLSKEVRAYPGSCVFYMAMNSLKPPFDNKTVRQAFATAIDRESYVKVILRDIGKPYYQFLPTAIAGSDPAIGQQFKFNVEKARKLLADAGYPGGAGFPKVRMNYTATAANQTRFEWFQAQFKEVLGVDIFANPMDGAVLQAATNEPINKLEGLTRLGWCADYFHASNYFGLVMGSGDKNGDGKLTEGEGNALNLPGFINAEFDKLWKQADSETDPAKQAELYKKAGEILVDEAPVAFMHDNENLPLIKPRVTKIDTNIRDGGHPGAMFWEFIEVE